MWSRLLVPAVAGFVVSCVLVAAYALGASPKSGGTFATDGAVQIWVRGTYKVVSITGSGRCLFQPPLGHEYLVGGDAVITIQSMLGAGCGDESHLTCRTPVQLEFDPVGGPSFHPLGDFNMDSVVDLEDFSYFQRHFGAHGPSWAPKWVPDESSRDDNYTEGY